MFTAIMVQQFYSDKLGKVTLGIIDIKTLYHSFLGHFLVNCKLPVFGRVSEIKKRDLNEMNVFLVFFCF